MTTNHTGLNLTSGIYRLSLKSHFSPEDNSLAKLKKEKAIAKSVKLEGYISPAGKLVIPAKSFEQLDLPIDLTWVKVGTDTGKRKIKTLYLVPSDSEDNGFELVKAAKSYTISLDIILKKGGIDFGQTKYSFTLTPFTDESGTSGYALKLTGYLPKPVYTGKPSGRKPKSR
ncbi:hypothetical protein [Spirosoma flavum]|uniref:Uncharacterized protein n=1 Tax=Spirosoma flavum TaxID=2048557 RepID=A0ABW6AV48_9BACT